MKSLDEDYKNKIKLVKEKAKLVPREHKWDYCGNAFKTKVTLVQHKKSLHSDIRPYKCRECPSTFKRSGHLKLHEILVHQNSREFQCKLCPKSFNTKNTLRAVIQKTENHSSIVFCSEMSQKTAPYRWRQFPGVNWWK